MHEVAFPGLGLTFEMNRIAIPLPFGSGGIRWYALIILAGICLAFLAAFRETKRLGEKTDHLYDLVLYGLPAAIIGARLYYVIFTWDTYKDNLWSVLYVWEGGIAIYGGVIGAFISTVIYCRKKKISLLRFLDIGAYGFLIGQAVGRWGNFVNGEAYGAPTTLPWRMVVDGMAVHPTFLYESLWNALTFLYIWLTRKKKHFDGRAVALYMVFYGTGRFWIEGLRQDSLMLGNIRISQLVSIALVIAGLFFYRYRKQIRRKKQADM